MKAFIAPYRPLPVLLMAVATAVIVGSLLFAPPQQTTEGNSLDESPETDEEAHQTSEEEHARQFPDRQNPIVTVDVNFDGVYIDDDKVQSFPGDKATGREGLSDKPDAKAYELEKWLKETGIHNSTGDGQLGRFDLDFDDNTVPPTAPPATMRIRTDGLVELIWFKEVLATLGAAGFDFAILEMPDWFTEVVDEMIEAESNSFFLDLWPDPGEHFCGSTRLLSVPGLEAIHDSEYSNRNWLKKRMLGCGEIDGITDGCADDDTTDLDELRDAFDTIWMKDVLPKRFRPGDGDEPPQLSPADRQRIRGADDTPVWLYLGTAIRFHDQIRQYLERNDPHLWVGRGIYLFDEPRGFQTRVWLRRYQTLDEYIDQKDNKPSMSNW